MISTPPRPQEDGAPRLSAIWHGRELEQPGTEREAAVRDLPLLGDGPSAAPVLGSEPHPSRATFGEVRRGKDAPCIQAVSRVCSRAELGGDAHTDKARKITRQRLGTLGARRDACNVHAPRETAQALGTGETAEKQQLCKKPRADVRVQRAAAAQAQAIQGWMPSHHGARRGRSLSNPRC